MNSSPEKKNISKIIENQTADPFAADIFAEAKKNGNSISDLKEEPRGEAGEKPIWIWRLPKAARPSTNWTNLLQNLPTVFSEKLPRSLAASLAGILNAENESSIQFAFVENREADEKEEISEEFWQALIGIEPNGAKLTVEIEDVFAVWLIDRALGEIVSEPLRQRDLTPSEIAVLEYLFVNLIYEANATCGAPLFKFVSLIRKRPRLITPDESGELKKIDSYSVLVSKWQAIHDSQRSLIKIVLAPETFEGLQSAEASFLNEAQKRERMFRAIENRVNNVRARLLLGETRTTLDEVAGIETGDVILIERFDLTANRNEFHGSAEIFLGEGESFRIVGTVEPADFASPDKAVSADGAGEKLVRRVNSNHNLQFLISYFELPTDANFIEKSMNEDFENLSDQSTDDFADESSEDGVALENLAVTLRVELEARRLSLADVGNLRVNQIIELGARATDPVNLIIGDKTIARGELVEVEDRLGVRIIQILR